MNEKGFTLIELMIVVVIIGILAAIAIPNFQSMTSKAKEGNVRSNCHTVRLAAEDFAIQDGGIYASDLADVSVLGETIVDMLPNADLLANPFTQTATEPVDGAAGNPGETGYEPVVDALGVNVGYTISGFGKSTTITTMTNQ